ncbi:MAG: NAD(P)H-dependent oxidoreductase [Thaumarchaeota archaeon]|nr:NAD(P)H-dependent oxidoreductase [Nitrososphaerota archaeon]
MSVNGEPVEIRIVGLSGSLRVGSATRTAVQYALRGAEEEGAKIELLDLAAHNLPFLGVDQDENSVKAVERFRAELRTSDGMILGSPEIHGSVSGVLKNALDLVGYDEFEGKMVGLVGVAGGRMGATETLSHMRTIGRSLHAWVVPNQVSIGDSNEAFDAKGNPTSLEVGNRLKSVGKQVAHFALLHKCENHMQFLKEWEGAPAAPVRTPSDPVV